MSRRRHPNAIVTLSRDTIRQTILCPTQPEQHKVFATGQGDCKIQLAMANK